MEDIRNPHDKLFREIWSRKPEAQSFLEHYVPENVRQLIEPGTLEICKDSFIDQELRDYFSDMLYKVVLQGEAGYVYIGNQAWPHGTHFADLLSESKKTLAAYIPDFAMILTDLTRYSDEDIKGTVLSQVILLLFKYISHPEFRPKLPEIFALMHKLSQQEHGLQYLELILRYIVVRPKMFRQKNVSA